MPTIIEPVLVTPSGAGQYAGTGTPIQIVGPRSARNYGRRDRGRGGYNPATGGYESPEEELTSQAPTGTSVKSGVKFLEGKQYQTYYDFATGKTFIGNEIKPASATSRYMSVAPSVQKQIEKQYNPEAFIKGSEKYSLDVKAFNLKYGGKSLSPEEYEKATKEQQQLEVRRKALLEEQSNLNYQYNIITKGTSPFRESVKRQESWNTAIEKFFKPVLEQPSWSDVKFTKKISPVKLPTGPFDKRFTYYALTSTAEIVPSTYFPIQRLQFQENPLVQYDKDFYTKKWFRSGAKPSLTGPIKFNLQNPQLQQRPLETGLAIVNVALLGRSAYSLGKYGVQSGVNYLNRWKSAESVTLVSGESSASLIRVNTIGKDYLIKKGLAKPDYYLQMGKQISKLEDVSLSKSISSPLKYNVDISQSKTLSALQNNRLIGISESTTGTTKGFSVFEANVEYINGVTKTSGIVYYNPLKPKLSYSFKDIAMGVDKDTYQNFLKGLKPSGTKTIMITGGKANIPKFALGGFQTIQVKPQLNIIAGPSTEAIQTRAGLRAIPYSTKGYTPQTEINYTPLISATELSKFVKESPNIKRIFAIPVASASAVIPKESFNLKLTPTQLTGITQKSKQLPELKNVSEVFGGRPTTPYYQTPIPETPKFPPFIFGGGAGGGLSSRIIKVTKLEKYTPSYTALVFNIRGLKPEKYGGLKIRPIPKKFNWFNLKL